MLAAHPRQKVFLAVGATDMRKQVDGLSAMVQADFALNPCDPYLFAFCNRRKTLVKILEWSQRGFWLHYFRLDEGKLPWPDTMDEGYPMELTWEDLRHILEGNTLRPKDQRFVKVPKYLA